MQQYVLKQPLEAIKIDVNTDMSQFFNYWQDEEGILYIQPLETDTPRSCVEPCYIFRKNNSLWWRSKTDFESEYIEVLS